MGIFTENEIWYVSTTVLDDGTVAYTKPIKSKLPTGLRDGDEVITALDGQALIFPTGRGLVALAPQDFIATTEKTLSYLSDMIQAKYAEFYESDVQKPRIGITIYKYWILLYKYLDKEILAFDTRSATWWIWTTPYPIRSITGGTELRILMQIDFLPTSKDLSLLGVPFVLDDTAIKYEDDTIVGATNGTITEIQENEYVNARRIYHLASPVIDWYFVSQRLHFNQINNYKAIKSINLNVRGEGTIGAKLSTKVYRNLYHPEQNDVMEIKVNDLRTFVKRVNLLHVLDFQYKIENDTETDVQHRFQLNSLSIKYEVKERVR